MNPEKLDELFFTKVKGWKWCHIADLGQSFKGWHDENMEYQRELPPLRKSLDLQEEWLWPELWKKGIDYAHFVYEVGNKNIICRMCTMVGGESRKAKIMYGNLSQTKAIVQLTAGLKALGIEVTDE
jgi:hypothetical protein